MALETVGDCSLAGIGGCSPTSFGGDFGGCSPSGKAKNTQSQSSPDLALKTQAALESMLSDEEEEDLDVFGLPSTPVDPLEAMLGVVRQAAERNTLKAKARLGPWQPPSERVGLAQISRGVFGGCLPNGKAKSSQSRSPPDLASKTQAALESMLSDEEEEDLDMFGLPLTPVDPLEAMLEVVRQAAKRTTLAQIKANKASFRGASNLASGGCQK